MRVLFLFAFLIAFNCTAQEGSTGLVIGNVNRICLPDTLLVVSDSLPDSLFSYNTIFLFSNATSFLESSDVNRIEKFVEDGGGLYSGADNWPLQAEANQITQQIYKKESFGYYEAEIARSAEAGNLKLNDLDTIPAGSTTSAFPMDYRLKVEAWVEDQPLIQSGTYGSGRIVIDTGYSRFYCGLRDENSDVLFWRIYEFLRE